MSDSVRIIEMGPRDGLQNEKTPLGVADRIGFVKALVDAGLTTVEVGAFVSPKAIPQMIGSDEVMRGVAQLAGEFHVLVPNVKGYEAARAAGAKVISVFAAASESFSHANINCSIAESLERFRPVVEAARAAEIKVRGYVSCALGCPYEGEVPPLAVADVAQALLEMGCYEISLGDTIGVGTPGRTRDMIEAVARRIPLKKIAGHYHDTFGMAAANIYASLQMGIGIFDSSVAGLGGCPYAAGASGNVATEDVVWLLSGLGIDTGIDLDALVDTGVWISKKLKREPASRVAHAILARRAMQAAAGE